MFAEERQEKLLGILREKRKVAVSEMCDVFNVSGATIRADLRQLEEEGLLTRTHGGAVLRTRASFEQASDDREIVNLSAKERIGQRAAALVEDGDIIVLDTGTTTLHIARNAQFTAADRIDTVVVDRLPDDVQAYRNAGIQVISLDEENLL
ncbi:DeoR/GlpR family DNA-binding transcription regulator [Klebsiella pneumoniae]